MNITLFGTALVDDWRNGAADNPAGPLFTGGEFAQADIVNQLVVITNCCQCTGSIKAHCC